MFVGKSRDFLASLFRRWEALESSRWVAREGGHFARPLRRSAARCGFGRPLVCEPSVRCKYFISKVCKFLAPTRGFRRFFSGVFFFGCRGPKNGDARKQTKRKRQKQKERTKGDGRATNVWTGKRGANRRSPGPPFSSPARRDSSSPSPSPLSLYSKAARTKFTWAKVWQSKGLPELLKSLFKPNSL